MEHINFKSDQTLDQIKDENILFLNEAVPWISWKDIEKNLLFIELLNEYKWKDFRWIHDFLDKKNYDTEAVRLLKQEKKSKLSYENEPESWEFEEDYSWAWALLDEEEAEARSWELFVWLKPFIQDFWTEKQTQCVYLVLAKKRKKFNMDKVKDTVIETIFWNRYSSEK